MRILILYAENTKDGNNAQEGIVVEKNEGNNKINNREMGSRVSI